MHFESIPKIVGVEKRRSCGHFSIQAGKQKLYKEMKWTEVVCEAQGLYFVQVLCQRGLLSSVNTSQSPLQGDPAWIYEALLQALKSPLWPKHGLTRHHLKVNLEPSGGETGGKASSIFGERTGHPTIGCYMDGALRQLPNQTTP